MATKELQSIVQAREAAVERGQPAALVTVFQTTGSTYRRAGARMLVMPTMSEKDGTFGGADALGSVSGGCLEDDVRERAQEALAKGRCASVEYDTTPEADVILGSGLGCQGIVRLLIQPLPSTRSSKDDDPLKCIARAWRERKTGVLASVCAGEDQLLGAFLWLEDGMAEGIGTLTERNAALADEIASTARAMLRGGKSTVITYPATGGTAVEVFLEAVQPPRSLLICGAGQDAAPLARFGKEIGWRVRVIDARRACATRARFPDVDELVVCPPAHFAARGHTVEPGEAVVLMSHHYAHDKEFLRMALSSTAGYIGVLGPRRRTARMISEVVDASHPRVGKRSLQRIHGPAGLDIGAETPEQIALAIIAEIEAVTSGRRGGTLKRRRAPLHDHPDSREARVSVPMN